MATITLVTMTAVEQNLEIPDACPKCGASFKEPGSLRCSSMEDAYYDGKLDAKGELDTDSRDWGDLFLLLGVSCKACDKWEVGSSVKWEKAPPVAPQPPELVAPAPSKMSAPKLAVLARKVARACTDAYSADRYASWEGVAKTLLRAGYSAAQAEAIMRSKVTRWAADQHGGGYGKIPASVVLPYFEKTYVGTKAEILGSAAEG